MDLHDSSGDPKVPSPTTHLPSIWNQFHKTSNLNSERCSQGPTERVDGEGSRQFILIKDGGN